MMLLQPPMIIFAAAIIDTPTDFDAAIFDADVAFAFLFFFFDFSIFAIY